MPASKDRFGKVSTNSLIALAALVALLAVVALILVGRMLLGKIVLNSKVISAKMTAKSQLDKNIAALPSLASSYQVLGNLQGVIETAMPTKPDFPALVALAEAIAGSSGVELDSVSPGAASANGSTAVSTVATPTPTVTTGATTTAPSPYPISFNVKGSYQTVLKFLSNVQLSTRPLQITGVSTNGTTSQLTATINATAYYYNPAVLADKTKVVK